MSWFLPSWYNLGQADVTIVDLQCPQLEIEVEDLAVEVEAEDWEVTVELSDS